VVYGFMTHSFLKSTEHRQMKKERAQITANWKRGPDVFLPVACTCRYKPFPHLGHAELRDTHDWRPRQWAK
jgi:hypothetical protein